MKIILTILTLAVAGALYSVNQTDEPSGKGDTQYILVKSALMMRSGILKPNAALLIEDKKEIRENEGMFLGNETFGHSCGYHYIIQFWKSSDELVDDIPFNQECEEFFSANAAIQSTMQSYIKQLETKPTHYIYNLEIPVTTKPEVVRQAFLNSEFTIFFLYGKSAHYKTLTFNYNKVVPIKEMVDRSKWQAEQDENEKRAIKKMETIIALIGQTTDIVEQSDISIPMQSFGGGEIEHQGEVTLKFTNGTDLSKVKEIITSNNGTIDKEFNPEKYFVQLVHESDNLEEVRKRMQDFKFVNAIYEYPQRK